MCNTAALGWTSGLTVGVVLPGPSGVGGLTVGGVTVDVVVDVDAKQH